MNIISIRGNSFIQLLVTEHLFRFSSVSVADDTKVKNTDLIPYQMELTEIKIIKALIK